MLHRRRVILSRNENLFPKREYFSESMLSLRTTSMIEEEQEEGERGGRLAGWLAGWLIDWLVGWLAGRLGKPSTQS